MELIMLGLVGLLVMIVVFAGLSRLAAWIVTGAARWIRRTIADGNVPRALPACPRCEALTLGEEGAARCPLCGWSARGEAAPLRLRPVSALAYLRRLVERWGRLGLLPQATRDRLVDLLIAEAERLEATRRPAPESNPTIPTVRTNLARVPEGVAAPALPPLPSNEAMGAVRPPVPAKPLPARWGALVAAFLEERSIRWGEVIGGLLVVGCSLALVVSFWGRIAERPILRAGLGWVATALVVELGRLASRRWRLPATGIALATVGTLLVPLNALALAASGFEVGGMAVVGTVVASALVGVRAAPHLASGPAWTLLLGIVGPTVGMLAGGRPDVPDAAAAVGAWLACLGAVGGWLLGWEKRHSQVADLYRLLGVSVFAALVATGRAVVAGAGSSGTIPAWLAGVVPLVSLPLLIASLAVQRRANRESDPVASGTVSLALALGGLGSLGVGLVMAWPEPARLIPVALLDALILGIVAAVTRRPAARAALMLCLTLPYLLSFELAWGRLGWWASANEVAAALLSGLSGLRLVPVVLLAVAGVIFERRNAVATASWATVVLLLGGASLGLATLDGLGRVGDPTRATWTFAAIALMAPGLAWFWPEAGGARRRATLNVMGTSALLLALVQGFVFEGIAVDLPSPAIAALNLHAALAGGLAWGLDRWSRSRAEHPRTESLARVASRSGLVTAGLVAVALGLGAIQAEVPALVQAGYGLTLASTTLILAAPRRSVAGVVLAAGAAGWALVSGRMAGASGGIVPLDATMLVEWSQGTALVAALAVLGWAARCADRSRWPDAASAAPVGRAWAALLQTSLILTLGTIALGVIALWADPTGANVPVAHAAGALPGFASGVAALLAWAGWTRLHGRNLSRDELGVAVAALLGFVACQMSGRFGPWSGYHFLMIAPVLLMGSLMIVAWSGRSLNRPGTKDPLDDSALIVRWGTIALMISLLFTGRGYRVDPNSPRNTAAMLGVLAALASGLGAWSERRAYLAVGAGLLNLGASLGLGHWPGWTPPGPAAWGMDLLALNAIALALPVPLWYAIEGRFRGERLAQRAAVPLGSILSALGLGAFTLAVGIGLIVALGGGSALPNTRLGWLAAMALLGGIGSGAWVARARGVAAGLYALGLAAGGWGLIGWHLSPAWLAWLGAIGLASYAVLTCYLASRASGLRVLGDRLGMPRSADQTTTGPPDWLVAATGAIAGFVLLLAFRSVLVDEGAILRLGSAQAVLGVALAVGLLAIGARRSSLQIATLALIAAGALAHGWAGIDPGRTTAELDRAAVAVVVGLGAAAGLGLGLIRWVGPTSDWLRAARRVVPVLVVLTGVTLLGLLLGEAGDRWAGRAVRISPVGGIAVAWSLLVGIAGALVAAVVPGRDPLNLPDRRRIAYVYGAEALLAGLAAHARMTLPGWFDGWLAAVWPLGLMGLAFLGVGLAALARRSGQIVLADPLERTGAILPAFPVAAALLRAPVAGRSEVFLVLVALLYAGLGTTRRSSIWGLLAALAGNSAIWAWLSGHAAVGLLIHPQLWVIPPALSILVAAQCHAARLGPERLGAVRNAALAAIYLASLADVVLVGVGRAPWLPIVLGAWALGGIAAGLALRVRGFLVLGSGALGLALFALLWLAAVEHHQTWLWSASGVIVGVAILSGAALLERHRVEVRQALDRFQEWQP